MELVLDASLTIACLFEDEATEAGLEVLDRVGEHGAWVPALWHLEVANSLRIGVKRGRCDEEFVDQALVRLAELPINIDTETMERAWHETIALAKSDGLTLYDASYLELAIRRGLAIGTCDRALARAAESYGIGILGQ